MKKNRKIIFLLIIILIYIYSKNTIIHFNASNNYSGIGKEIVKNNIGYLSTFTTIEEHKKIYREYKQNIPPWNNNEYWGGTMEKNGCGITSLATILSGYNKNYTPEDLRKKYYPHLDSEKISKELSNTYNIENSDFYFDSVHLSDSSIKEHLKSNRPILVCLWNKPKKNKWTEASHYMVLLAIDDKDLVYISNPNGLENSNKSSGWYNLKEITPYLAKALYIESY